MDTIIGSPYVKPTPIFSFNTIVDEDVSLLRFIITDYYDETIFDFSDIMTIDFAKVIGMIYYRTVDNPLRLFMAEGADENFVDECYHEFLSEKEDKILEACILTEIPDLIKMYQDSAGISPSVFYYNDTQLHVLDQIEELNGIEKVPISDVSNERYSQIYINHHTEVKNFPDLKRKTFYIASSQRNVDALENLNDYEHLVNLAINENRISIYDLYNTELIKGE